MLRVSTVLSDNAVHCRCGQLKTDGRYFIYGYYSVPRYMVSWYWDWPTSITWRACMTGHDADFKYIIGHYSLKSLNDLLVSFEFRNLIGCERREERDSNENASSYAERHTLRILGDPGAVSRAGLKGTTKVFKHGLENFCRAFSPGPANRPWVSEDVRCVAVLFFSRVSVSFIFSALSRVPARSHFRHLNFCLAYASVNSTRAQPLPRHPPG